MPKVKLTKTALKQERDSLKQFQRFLPTLQLKKQQLQMEMRTCLDRIERNRELERETKQALASWTALFGDPESVEKIRKNLSVREVITGEQNIAGVDVPVFQEVVFDYRPFDCTRRIRGSTMRRNPSRKSSPSRRSGRSSAGSTS